MAENDPEKAPGRATVSERRNDRPTTRPLTRWGSPAEQETIIRWDRESDTVSLFTADPTIARRIEADLVVTRESIVDGQPVGRWYRVSKTAFRFKVGRRAQKP